MVLRLDKDDLRYPGIQNLLAFMKDNVIKVDPAKHRKFLIDNNLSIPGLFETQVKVYRTRA